MKRVGLAAFLAAAVLAACGPVPTVSPLPGSATPGVASTAAPTQSPAAVETPSAAPALTPAPTMSPTPTFPAALPGVVPILYYHRVQAPPPAYATWTKAQQAAFIDYDALPTAFAAQLDWLKANGYTTILPRDLAAHWDKGTALPPRPVILTFDDGTHDWVSTVLPMLRARGMVAEFYLTLASIADGLITWAEVETLAAAGEGVGAHDVHHVQLAMLGRGRPAAAADTMWAEVSGARQIIGAHIGVPPDSMAYVGGGFDVTLEGLVQRAGYTTARAILRGIAQSKDLRYELRVVRIGPYDDVVDVVTGVINPALPVFTARMRGVTGRVPTG